MKTLDVRLVAVACLALSGCAKPGDTQSAGSGLGARSGIEVFAVPVNEETPFSLTGDMVEKQASYHVELRGLYAPNDTERLLEMTKKITTPAKDPSSDIRWRVVVLDENARRSLVVDVPRLGSAVAINGTWYSDGAVLHQWCNDVTGGLSRSGF
jgi:hypothetical protein